MVAILVTLTIVACIMADAIAQWAKARREQEARHPASQQGHLIPTFAFEGLSVPPGIFLDSGHTWVELDASGRVRVGMDDFAQRVIGRIDEIELPPVGEKVRQGEKLFAIRQGDRTADFMAPLDGVIHSVNQSLARHSEAIQADPYHQGWICSLSPKELAKSLRRLSIAEEAMAWLNQEVQRFQAFIFARPIENMALGHVLQDGGQPVGGILEWMDEGTWRLFSRQFLRAPVVEKGPERKSLFQEKKLTQCA